MEEKRVSAAKKVGHLAKGGEKSPCQVSGHEQCLQESPVH